MSQKTMTAPRIRRFAAEPLFMEDEGPELVRAMNALSRKIRLDESLAWMMPEDEWRLSSIDISCFVGSMSRAPTFAPAAVVTPVRHKVDLARVAPDIGVKNGALKDWNWPMATERLKYAPGRTHAGVFGLAARRPGMRRCEGIITGSRYVLVTARDEGSRLEAEYVLALDFIYVRPEARGHLLGAALTSGAINQAQHDISSLHEQFSVMAEPPPFTTRVSGEAHSEEGLAALDNARDAIEDFVDDLFEDEIGCGADYSL